MFPKQPLYKAKQDNLNLAVKLLNAQSKTLLSVYLRSQTRQQALEQEMTDLAARAKQGETISVEQLTPLCYEKNAMGLQASLIKDQVEDLARKKQLILAKNNAIYADRLFFTDPFTQKLNDMPPDFISADPYLADMRRIEKDFDAVCLNHENLVFYRMVVVLVLMGILYLLLLAALLAMCTMITIFVHPIIGYCAYALTTAAIITASLLDFDRYLLDQGVKAVTEINEHITLDEREGESLFSELKALEAALNQSTGPSSR